MSARKRTKREKDDRIDIRCSSEDKKTLQEAADRERLTLTSWLLRLGLREAAKSR